MSIADSITTAEQLLAARLPHSELIGGELVMMSPAGFDHGRIASRIVTALENHVAQKKLGVVTTAEAGFLLAKNPDTVRAPDVAFVHADRIPATGVKGFFQGAPDIAVEVVSPNDRPSEVAAKVQGWLAAGSTLVWIIDPENQTIVVHNKFKDVMFLNNRDTLMGDDVLPGFAFPVAAIFA